MNSEHIHNDDWEKDAPLLASLKEEMDMEVPEGYFDSLPKVVMDRIRMEDEQGQKVQDTDEEGVEIPFDSRPQPLKKSRRAFPYLLMATAASLALLIGVWIAIPTGKTIENIEIAEQIHGLDREVILASLDVSDLDEEDILSFMSDDALDGIQSQSSLDDESILEFLEDADLDAVEFENFEL